MAKYSIVVQKVAQKQLEAHYRSGDKGSIKGSIKYLKNSPNILKQELETLKD